MFSWALVAVVSAAALALIVVPKATGARPLTVLSGSMAPAFDPGDVVVVRPTDPEHLEVGDVITFQPVSDDPRLTTHRVHALVFGNDGTSYVTKGDANDAPDPEPVTAAQIKGEVWYDVPWVGHVSLWLASGWLRTVVDLLAVGLILSGGWFVALGLRDRLRGREVAA